MPDTLRHPTCFPSATEEKDRLRPGPAIDAQSDQARHLMLLDELARLRATLGRVSAALARARTELADAQRAAGNDALTGLPNRQGFWIPSRRALSSHGQGRHALALLFVDLDGFKAVNDRLGHAVGDALLRVVGARLAGAVRDGDLVCRHGGDEFLCLLTRLAVPQHAASIARDLINAIAVPCHIGRHQVHVRASIGIAMYPHDGRTIGALVASADAAMYRAKASGLGVDLANAHALDAMQSAPHARAPCVETGG